MTHLNYAYIGYLAYIDYLHLMKNLNYIHINNDNFKNNFNRNAITPKVNLKEVNSISPKYKNVNFKNNITTYSQQEKINFNFIEENNEKSINN